MLFVTPDCIEVVFAIESVDAFCVPNERDLPILSPVLFALSPVIPNLSVNQSNALPNPFMIISARRFNESITGIQRYYGTTQTFYKVQ